MYQRKRNDKMPENNNSIRLSREKLYNDALKVIIEGKIPIILF